MAIKSKSEFSIIVGEDNYARIAFERENVKREQEYDNAISGVLTIAGGATVALPLGGITSGKLAFFEADGALTLVVNTTHNVPIAPVTGQKARFWLDGTAITALSVTNAGSASVKLNYLVAA